MNKRNVLILLLLMGSILSGYAESLMLRRVPSTRGFQSLRLKTYEEALQFLIKGR